MRSQDVIDILKRNGWALDRVVGSHHIFVNSDRSRHVTVPHPRKDVILSTLKRIEKQAGIKLR